MSKPKLSWRQGLKWVLKVLGVLLGLTLALTAIWATIYRDAAAYLVQSARGQLQLLSGGETVENLLKSPKSSAKLKHNLELVQEVKAFAESHLKLKPTLNYQNYLDLKRDYLVMVLTASPPLKMESKTWWFPIVGTVPYKGYFDKSMGLADQKTLQAEGFETNYRPSPAYSTLGWFRDPLLSTMMLYGDFYLANTVIHESVHATHWIPGEVTFNENMASFIGNQGAQLFYAHKYGKDSKEYRDTIQTLKEQKIFAHFMNLAAKELEKVYQQKLADSDMLKAKQAKIKELKARYVKDILPQIKTPGYAGFEKQDWNNALMMSYLHYNAELDKLEAFFDKQGRDIPKMMEFLKQPDIMSHFK